MLTCPYCNRPGISFTRKLSLGHTKPAPCGACGGEVVLPLRAQMSVIPLVVLLVMGPGLFYSFGKLWVSVAVGLAVVLIPILNVALFRAVPFRGAGSPDGANRSSRRPEAERGAVPQRATPYASTMAALEGTRERPQHGATRSSTTVTPQMAEAETELAEGYHAQVKLLSLLVLVVVCAAAVRYGLVYAKTPAFPSALDARRITEHFEICSNLGERQLDHQALFFEQFFQHFEERWFPVPQSRRLRLFLFAATDSYEAYVRDNFTGYTNYGFYSGDHNLVVINLETGLGTATHVLVRHFIAVAFARSPPPWIEDGFAAFFEKFLGHIDETGKLHISFGYFSNWRFPQTKAVGPRLSIEALARASDVDQGAARCLMLYLHKQGVLRRFIDAARTHDGSDYTALLCRAAGRSLDELEQDWKGWIEWQPVDANVLLVESSFVKSHEEWARWWQANAHRLYWSEEERIYKVRE